MRFHCRLLILMLVAAPYSQADTPKGWGCWQTYAKLASSYATHGMHFLNEEGPLLKTLRFFEDVANPVLRSAFPGLLNRLDGPTRGIFRKLSRDPAYELTPDEAAILKKYNNYLLYNRLKTLARRFPQSTWLLRTAGDVSDSIAKAIWLITITHLAQQLGDDDKFLGLEEFADGKQKVTADDEIQLLNETFPIPHMAIRIDDRVYSYGQTHLQVTSLAEYLLADSLPAALDLQKGEWAELAEEKNEESSSSRLSETIQDAVKGVSRNIQVVTLKVGKQKKDEVRRYLELNAWKQYHNETFVNDCSTMSLRAIGQESKWIDPSPSSVMMCFSILKTFGDSQVSDVFLIKDSKAPSRNPSDLKYYSDNMETVGMLARNTIVNFWDAAIHVSSLPVSIPMRVSIDQNFTSDDFQHHGETAKHIIASWRDEAEKALQDEPSISMHTKITDRFKRYEGSAEQRQRLRALALEQLESDFEKLMKEANDSYHNPSATLYGYWMAKYRLELLPEYKKRFLRDLQ